MCRAKGATFFMYINRLYKHNKFVCILVVLFAFAQLINNIRQDIAISPFYSYGMYSEHMPVRQTYTVPEILVNGKQLQTKDFTPQEWDNITVPVSKFYEQKEWNTAMWRADIHRLLPFSDSTIFLNQLNENDFKSWYKSHLANLLNRKIDSVAIDFNKYNFTGSTLVKSTF